MFAVVTSSERKQIKQNIIILHTVQNYTVKAKITPKDLSAYFKVFANVTFVEYRFAHNNFY